MASALYRRYRPDSFADVIGQEHVTDPLRAALRSDRVTHAYLFSGPRGCGKTTSARILARCLNCEQGPTDTPCGVCPSCIDLARGGPGSLDVVEIDAASHGGVEDARELRERAVFAPARDRFKVFIIDEAHMVTNQGFNALLKLVEEPPAHVKFVFATTEPDKVIGTIRSRTHHYPFRLVPPHVLQGYLAHLCDVEHVRVASGVLPLVVRAGGGSVRDSLSVLDQLMAGSGADGVSYDVATALLGFTHATLLDDVVDALAASDGATVFRVVDRVVESGHDPRRFVEDLLDRLRDLIVLAASGAEADSVLRTLPEDQLDRMRPQAQHLGPRRLSLAADIVNAGLTEMTGATSPRLQLELLLARALLETGASGAAAAQAPAPTAATPSPERGAAAPAAPIRVPVVASSPPTPAAPQHADDGASTVSHQTSPREPAPSADGTRAAGTTPPHEHEAQVRRQQQSAEQARSAHVAEPDDRRVAPVADVPPSAGPGSRAADAPRTEPRGTQPPAAAESGAGAAEERESSPASGAAPAVVQSDGSDAAEVRRRWPEVLQTLASLSRVSWSLVQNAQVAEVGAEQIVLSFTTDGLRSAFHGRNHAELVERALHETLGLARTVVAATDGPGGPGAPDGGSRPEQPGSPGGQPAPQGERRAPRSAETDGPEGSDARAQRARAAEAPEGRRAESADTEWADSESAESEPARGGSVEHESAGSGAAGRRSAGSGAASAASLSAGPASGTPGVTDSSRPGIPERGDRSATQAAPTDRPRPTSAARQSAAADPSPAPAPPAPRLVHSEAVARASADWGTPYDAPAPPDTAHEKAGAPTEGASAQGASGEGAHAGLMAGRTALHAVPPVEQHAGASGARDGRDAEPDAHADAAPATQNWSGPSDAGHDAERTGHDAERTDLETSGASNTHPDRTPLRDAAAHAGAAGAEPQSSQAARSAQPVGSSPDVGADRRLRLVPEAGARPSRSPSSEPPPPWVQEPPPEEGPDLGPGDPWDEMVEEADEPPSGTSSGNRLVGVPLVVKMLDGAVIDEISDEPGAVPGRF